MKELLLKELKEAMRNKDELRKNTISGLRAAILQVEKDDRVVLDDNGILEVIAKEVKKRKSSLEEYKKTDRQDIIDDLNREIEILTSFLPKQLTKEEIEAIVDEQVTILNAQTMKDMGKVMAAIKPFVVAKADSKLVSDIVKAKLQN